MAELGHHHAAAWRPHHQPTDADDIVVLVTDALFEYLPPDSGISPEEVIRRVRSVVDSGAGMASFVNAAMSPGNSADAVVVHLSEALDTPSAHPQSLVTNLLRIVESPLAIEVYDREMERRRPRDVDRWH